MSSVKLFVKTEVLAIVSAKAKTSMTNKLVPDAITEVARNKFLAYEMIRQSGVTNMWDVATVCRLSIDLLTEDDVVDIIKHYDYYVEKYLPERATSR
jgi:hypothetical protein